MSYYDPCSDSLYDESVVARDVIELVDAIRHSVYVISEQDRNPYRIRGIEIRLRNPKSNYSFFSELWANKDIIPSMTKENELGRRISDLHVTAILYAMRQNFFIRVSETNKGSDVGWYLDPIKTYIECLPDIFEDFEAVFQQRGALGLQGRETDILGYLSNDVAKYVQRNYREGAEPYRCVNVPEPDACPE